MSLRLSNRRKKTDPILQLIAWTNGTAVVSLILAVCLIAIAKPQRMNFLDHFYSVQRSSPAWNTDIFTYIGLTLLLSFMASAFGIYLNTKRLQRKGDYINATLVVSFVVSAIGLLFFIRNTLF